jgi:hypothetical protein
MRLSNGLEINGYRWCEAHNPYGLTYCFFNSEKLESPKKQKMENE